MGVGAGRGAVEGLQPFRLKDMLMSESIIIVMSRNLRIGFSQYCYILVYIRPAIAAWPVLSNR